ncbi:MAG: dTDP-4-dehydrorhamnose 3,5-epimerase [Betaproteobacteria bacterium]|nr:dTDP-4-dehydrorhamnose 3,5-epimerase [Betaproteobacteria bacterium]
MDIIDTEIPDLKIIQPKVYGDIRGFFYESFNLKAFNESLGLDGVNFVQDNHSQSQRGVLRGIHFQTSPYAQGKLVRVVKGEVFDVAVDLRPQSQFFGRSVAVLLSADNKRQFWIPEGFGHGFLTLSEEAEFLYKTTNYYSPEHEVTVSWDDATLGIDWPIHDLDLSLSEKDTQGIPFNELTKTG